MRSAFFKSHPRKILLHIGTNDIEQATPDEIATSLDTLLNLTRSKLPNTKIFISAVMVRRDLMDRVTNLNEKMQQIRSKFHGIILINHNVNIRESMLADKKHLTGKGFFTMLANFRFAMFGIMPKFQLG